MPIRSVLDVAGVEITFSEEEVAQILWVLTDATELAEGTDALSTLALVEDTLRMVRDRFDRRRPTEQ